MQRMKSTLNRENLVLQMAPWQLNKLVDPIMSINNNYSRRLEERGNNYFGVQSRTTNVLTAVSCSK